LITGVIWSSTFKLKVTMVFSPTQTIIIVAHVKKTRPCGGVEKSKKYKNNKNARFQHAVTTNLTKKHKQQKL
jgi:hypothetical protein